MAIPAYLWMKDDGGADIKGAVDVQDREGVLKFSVLVMVYIFPPITAPVRFRGHVYIHH